MRMPISSETRAALELLKDVQQKVRQTDNLRSNQQVNADLTTLISVLESPVFQSILNIQDSLRELKRQVQLHPSILPSDFDITPSGELVLNLPPNANQQRGNEQHPTPHSQNGISHLNTTNDAFHREAQNGYGGEEIQDVNENQKSTVGTHSTLEENNINLSNIPDQVDFDEEQKNDGSHFMDEAFRQKVEAAGQGRQLKYIRLHKPEGTSLGFSVVGLKSENKGELGIYVQEIQPHGIAAKDGQLREADQILAIDGQALDSNISHQQAINILQRARGNVDLAVARNPDAEADNIDESEKTKANIPSDSNIGSDWCQVEVIELVNNGSGLGFGIIGGQQAGVIVKTILRDGVADKDGRLKPNDFILQINEHWLQGVGSEQVAVVLRGTGSHVRLVVARPVDPNDPSAQRPNVPILPSAILTDRKALEMHLATGVITEQTPAPPPPTAYDKFGPPPFDSFGPTTSLANDMILPIQSEQVSIQHNASKSIDQTTSPIRNEELGSMTATTRFGGSSNEESMQPEMITLDVELVKDAQGLGVTIAGYTCEREELSGIFVKSVTEGSAAYRSGKVAVNDQIIEVDGRSIQGYTNQQAVEMLRSTGQVVRLKLIRYVHGFKFEQLQQAIANSQQPQQQQKQDFSGGMIRTDSVISEEASVDISVSAKSNEKDFSTGKDGLTDIEETFEGELDPTVEKGLITYWSKVMGPQYEIAVAQMAKFKPNGGLGISLEGTVEKVDGEEQNPHHYIRSVLPNGPVGQNGKLKSGDELLEVNGKKLLGLYHTDVVSILKDLPMHVRIVCARSNQTETQTDFATPMMARSTDYSLQGSVSSNVMDKQDRLFKAKSDGSIASSSGTTTEASQKESKLKSRSLEPLTSLAMWSEEIIAIELVKAEKGLGFSILDYQDPMNKDETVVVIRSLVPGGVAQQDGRLIPGDRLMYVNEVNLAHASLDEAVQALKGANRGIVKIGVSKPLPVPDSGSSNTTISQEDITTQSGKDAGGKGENGSSADDNTEVRSEVSDMESDGNGVFTPPPTNNTSKEQPPPLPTSPLPDDDETDANDGRNKTAPAPQGGRIILPPTERLIGGSSSTVVTTRYEPKTDHEDLIPPLPSALEHNIRVLKDSETLGVQVDIEEDGINGLVVRSIVPTGTLGRDGRIQAGDYMVKVNGENMRNISLNQALDILRRTQKVTLGNEIPITYIPASDAAVHKTSVITRITTEKDTSSKNEEENNEEWEKEGKEVVEESSLMKSAASFNNMPLSSGNNAPTPAARNTLLSSSTTRTEKKANGTTVISIGPGASMARTAPLVSPEGSEVDKSSPDTRKTSTASTNLAFHETGIPSQLPPPQSTTNVNKSTVYLNDTTRDESSTDDIIANKTEIDSTSPQPVVPPRPSKETTSPCSSVSSGSHSSHHSSPSKKVSTIELRNDCEKEGDRSLSSQINQMHLTEQNNEAVNQELNEDRKQQEDVEDSTKVDDKELEEASLSSQHWGPERTVEVVRVPGHGLGISIVGGKIDPFPRKGAKQGTSGAAVTGIFIKNVLAGSPAGATGQLCTGDRILEVDGNDLRKASHEKAVEIIRQSGNVVVFVVQSLLAYDDDDEGEDEQEEDLAPEGVQTEHLESIPSAIDSIPPVPPPGFENEYSDRASIHSDSDPSTLPPPPPPPLMEEMDGNSNWSQPDEKEVFDEDDSELDESDETKFAGQVTLPNGILIDRASAAFLRKSKNDPEIEDDYGYTTMKVHKKYLKDSQERGVPKLVSLNKGTNGLGISLAGHKDRSQMAIYICGLNPLGNAARVGGIEVGDLILEVNGTVLHNRHHLNASALIKNLPDSDVTFVLMRNGSGTQDVAVKPLTQYPPEPFKDNPIDRYSGKYKNVREVLLKKGQTGWGIMILEGKHSIAGTGVFVSDLQPGSCAEKAGLLRGDMILAVNGEDFVGVNYDTAARILKTLDGVITMIVANANIDCNASNHTPTPSTTEEKTEEKTLAPESPEKPKLPPKPAIAPKPAGISPSHTASKQVPNLGVPPPPASSAETPSDAKPTTPVKKPEPVKATAPQPPASASKTKKPVASPRRRGPGSSGDEFSVNPSTCEIVPGADTSIEITKDKDEDGKPMGLGLSIVGGSDTLLGAIFIHEVYEKGAAHKDGRLRPGDQILEVMSENLRNVTHSHALQALRQTPNRVKLIIHREDDEIYETLEVELLKKKDRGLGLSIVGKKSGPGVFISEVVKGGAADADGRLVQGDQILAVNGNDLTNSSQEEAAPVLKMAQGKILMQVRRLRVGNRRHQQQQQNKDDAEHGGASREKSLPPQPVMNGTPAIIELKRGEHGLGFSIVGGFGSPHGDMPVYVKTVFDTGAAAEHGGLKRGDQILSVNGNSLEGLTHLEAVNILKNCEGTVTLHIIS